MSTLRSSHTILNSAGVSGPSGILSAGDDAASPLAHLPGLLVHLRHTHGVLNGQGHAAAAGDSVSAWRNPITATSFIPSGGGYVLTSSHLRSTHAGSTLQLDVPPSTGPFHLFIAGTNLAASQTNQLVRVLDATGQHQINTVAFSWVPQLSTYAIYGGGGAAEAVIINPAYAPGRNILAEVYYDYGIGSQVRIRSLHTGQHQEVPCGSLGPLSKIVVDGSGNFGFREILIFRGSLTLLQLGRIRSYLIARHPGN